MKNFDSLKPCKIETDLFQSPTDQRAADFLLEYGNSNVEITDRHAQTVEHIQIRDLTKWWHSSLSNAFNHECKHGHVVHWPVPMDLITKSPFSAVAEVTSKLCSIEPALSSLFDEYPYERVPNFSWTIIGPSCMQIVPHRDMFSTASWNLLYSGRKIWQFWDPSHESTVGIDPQMQIEQIAGDLLWIPEQWWHAVCYQQSSICFSKNLILRRTLSSVRKELKARDKQLYNIVEAILLVENRKANATN